MKNNQTNLLSNSLVADLHIHGRYSRGTSKNLTIAYLEEYAKIKGVGLLGTGDFTHPEWIEEIKSDLTDDGTGIFRTKGNFPFILQTEIALVYSQDGKGRRVHIIILAPNLDAVSKITSALLKRGRVDYDGRPIFKIPCDEFVRMMRDINTDIEVIPAHIWTPWYSLLGAKSGFDSVKDAFGDQTKYINALETGLSSDPAMNRRVSSLDKYNLVSNSDLHSYWPWKMGRRATLFNASNENLTYKRILQAIRTGKGLSGTVEIDPNFGKYHFSGHRKCDIVLDPKETAAHNGICPKCEKPLVMGVADRVEQLADRPIDYIHPNDKPYYTMIPLSELLAAYYQKGVATKFVSERFNLLTYKKSEFEILLSTDLSEIEEKIDTRFAKIVGQNRKGKIKVKAGYDGVYGVPHID